MFELAQFELNLLTNPRLIFCLIADNILSNFIQLINFNLTVDFKKFNPKIFICVDYKIQNYSFNLKEFT